ncbi:CRAL-TRIO domain-containing protein C23B6.04c [Glycine max]|nr:CRAL-TRIO domain-containing protein C23B6.04c [Glycine max]
MLEDTLKWRSTYKPEDIRWDEIVVEGETGKLYRASVHDREGRIVLVLRPGMQWLLLNTSSKENQMRHLVYMLENAMLNLPHGQEQMSWLIDFTEWSFRNNSLKFMLDKKTIQKVKFVYPNNKDSVELMKCY